MGFQDLPYAQQFRDVIRELAAQEVKRLRPGGQLATVSSVDPATNTCMVIFPGDTDPVPVRMYTIQPTTGGGVGVGDVVRISGEVGTRRYVAEVVKGNALLRAGRITLAALQTTASSANLFVDATTGVVSRVTSSIRYKKNVENIEVKTESVSQLRAVSYQAISRDDGKKYLGLIAEEVAELNDPVLNQLVEFDYYGKPDAVNYDRLSVILLPVIQHLIQRVEALEARVADQA